MIKELLPPSIAADDGIQKLAQAQEGVWSFLFSEAVKPIILARIDQLPEETLDILAWQFHIEGYEFAKDLQEKRKLIKESIELHRLKGTLAGIKKALSISRANLVRVFTPHHRTFLSVSITDQDREKWLAQFPELRITNFAYRGKGRGNSFAGVSYPYFSDAPQRWGIRAYLVKGGQRIPLKTLSVISKDIRKQAISHVQVRIPGRAVGIFYRVKDKHLVKHEASKRLYSVKISQEYQDTETKRELKMLTPSIQPLSVRYKEIAEKGQYCRWLAFVYHLVGHTCMSDANTRLYKSIRVYDDDVVANTRNAFTHLNTKPISIPPYHAIVHAQIRGRRRFPNFLQVHDKRHLSSVIRTLSEFSSCRDKIMLDTKTKRPPIADGTITAGMGITIEEVINV